MDSKAAGRKANLKQYRAVNGKWQFVASDPNDLFWKCSRETQFSGTENFPTTFQSEWISTRTAHFSHTHRGTKPRSRGANCLMPDQSAQSVVVTIDRVVINGMVRRLSLRGGIRGEQEASHGDSHDWHRSG